MLRFRDGKAFGVRIEFNGMADKRRPPRRVGMNHDSGKVTADSWFELEA